MRRNTLVRLRFIKRVKEFWWYKKLDFKPKPPQNANGFMEEKLRAQRFNKLVLDHATEWWFQKTSLLIWLTTWRHQNGRKVNTELRRFFGASLISATTRMKFPVDICKSYSVSHQWRHKGNHILLMPTTTAFLEKLQHQHEENCTIRKPWWSP